MIIFIATSVAVIKKNIKLLLMQVHKLPKLSSENILFVSCSYC